MSVLQFSIDLSIPTARDMEKNILNEFVLHVGRLFNTSFPSIQTKARQIVADALRGSEAWASINGGELEKVLRIPSPSASLLQIEKAIIDDMIIERRTVAIAGQSVTGGFAVNLLEDSYRNVLSANSTSYVTANGKFIPWLEWLLFYGGSPVVPKAQLIQTPRGVFLVRAQTDLAIPSAYAGIPTDNILTRALLPVETKLGRMIEDEVSRRA